MSDDIWHDADLSEAKRTVEQQRDGNHSSLYSNPEQAARHLIRKYGVEEALAAWREMSRDPEVIRAVIAEGSEGNVDEREDG